MGRIRLDPEVRKAELLEIAFKLAEKTHYKHVTGVEIAREAGLYHSTIYRYFRDMAEVRRYIVRQAIKRENLNIIAQAIIARDVLVKKASVELKTAALNEALKWATKSQKSSASR